MTVFCTFKAWVVHYVPFKTWSASDRLCSFKSWAVSDRVCILYIFVLFKFWDNADVYITKTAHVLIVYGI